MQGITVFGFEHGQCARGNSMRTTERANTSMAMYDFTIPMDRASDEFVKCWASAGRHLERQAQGPLSWLRVHVTPQFLEHLSFRLGNQLFFIRVEDADEQIEIPGTRNGLLAVANDCCGHPCVMSMRRGFEEWQTESSGWGLIDVNTDRTLDPPTLISEELIEMTDWELHDFAIQIVRDKVVEQSRKLMTWTSHPDIEPGLWFVGEEGPEWVIIRAVRYPRLRADVPSNWKEIAKRCARLGQIGHFASVSLANANDPFDSTGKLPPLPLWRGHAMLAKYEGLDRLQ